MSLDAYQGQAGRYDRRTSAFDHWRELLVAQLPVNPGETVLDVGCGTGLCLPLLEEKVGAGGTVVGIDESEPMLALARARVEQHGWRNVELIGSCAARAPLPRLADAAAFCAVHDLLQCPDTLRNVFTHLRPGAAIAATGGKWPSPWLWPLRSWVADLHAPFIRDFAGFDEPWRLLGEFVDDLEVTELASGAGYLAVGHAR